MIGRLISDHLNVLTLILIHFLFSQSTNVKHFVASNFVKFMPKTDGTSQ